MMDIWIFGVVLAVILQCWLRGRPSRHETAFYTLTIIAFALAWPVVLMIGVLTIATDTIHFLIKVAKSPH